MELLQHVFCLHDHPRGSSQPCVILVADMTQGQIINIVPQRTSLPDSGDRYGRDRTLFIIIISHQESPEHSSGQILVYFYYYLYLNLHLGTYELVTFLVVLTRPIVVQFDCTGYEHRQVSFWGFRLSGWGSLLINSWGTWIRGYGRILGSTNSLVADFIYLLFNECVVAECCGLHDGLRMAHELVPSIIIELDAEIVVDLL